MVLMQLLQRILAPSDNSELVRAYQAHVADLQSEIANLRDMVRVLSDEKFFAPMLAKREPQASEPYRPMFPADSLSDVETFNADKDAETASQQDKLAAELEQEFYSLAVEQAVHST